MNIKRTLLEQLLNLAEEAVANEREAIEQQDPCPERSAKLRRAEQVVDRVSHLLTLFGSRS